MRSCKQSYIKAVSSKLFTYPVKELTGIMLSSVFGQRTHMAYKRHPVDYVLHGGCGAAFKDKALCKTSANSVRGICEPQPVVVLYCGETVCKDIENIIKARKLLNIKLGQFALCGKCKLRALISHIFNTAHSFKVTGVFYRKLHRKRFVYHRKGCYL